MVLAAKLNQNKVLIGSLEKVVDKLLKPRFAEKKYFLLFTDKRLNGLRQFD
jgi:hypothetical protein